METEAYNMHHGDLKRSSTIHVSHCSCSLGSLLNYMSQTPWTSVTFQKSEKTALQNSFSNLHGTTVPDSIIARISVII